MPLLIRLIGYLFPLEFRRNLYTAVMCQSLTEAIEEHGYEQVCWKIDDMANRMAEWLRVL